MIKKQVFHGMISQHEGQIDKSQLTKKLNITATAIYTSGVNSKEGTALKHS